MDLFDVLDDDFEVKAREARPLLLDLHAVEAAVLLQQPARLSELRAGFNDAASSAGLTGSPWAAVCSDVLDVAGYVVGGDYVGAVTRTVVGKAVMGESSEAGLLATLTVLSSFGSLRRLLHSKASSYILNGDGEVDSFLSPAPGSDLEANEPATFRAAAVGLVAAACLQLFAQANWTGPTLSDDILEAVHPLPYTFLRASEVNPSVPDAAAASGASGDADVEGAGEDAAGEEEVKEEPTGEAPEADDDTPHPKLSPAEVRLDASVAQPVSRLHTASLDSLVAGGEDMYEHILFPHFLATARALYEAITDHTTLPKEVTVDKRMRDVFAASSRTLSVDWWAGRALSLHHRSLINNSAAHLLTPCFALYQRVGRRVCPTHATVFTTRDTFDLEYVRGVPAVMAASPPLSPQAATLCARVLLEWGMVQHHFDRVSAAKTSFFVARAVTGLRTQLTGAMGRRTKFQQHDLAQLVLRAASELPPLDDVAGAKPSAGVKEVALDEADADTILLERMKFAQTEEDVVRKAPAKAFTLGETDYNTPSEVAEDEAKAAEAPSLADSAEDVTDTSLTVLDQGIVLALCLDVKNHNPLDGLTYEEMRPYVARVLHKDKEPSTGKTGDHLQASDWMTYSTALLVKSMLEFENHRTQERAVLQMQALADQQTSKVTAMQFSTKVIEDDSPVQDRLAYLYHLVFPPRWDLNRQLANKYMKLQVVASALQLYEELHLWEDMIECYILLDKISRAKKLVQARLDVSPTARLWCVMGALLDEDWPYERAWEISGQKFAKAQLGLGKRMYYRGDHEGCMAALQAGLNLSPNNPTERFILGMVSMKLENFPLALSSFTAVVQDNPDRADAWANLGSINLHIKQYEKAFHALTQAVRLRRDNWRMVSNLISACVAIGNYSRAISAMHQLLDLRHADDDNSGLQLSSLSEVVTAVVASMDAREGAVGPAGAGSEAPPATVDIHGNPPHVHEAALAKLLGHITSATSTNPYVWSMYAVFNAARGRPDDVIDCRVKECRSLQTANWERDGARVAGVVETTRHLVAAYLRSGTKRHLSAARMHLKPLISRVEKHGESIGEEAGTMLATLRDLEAQVAAAEPTDA